MNFNVQTRAANGKGANRQLRMKGLTPGIIYGKGEPRMVQMRADYATRFVHGFKGVIKPFELVIEDGSKTETITAIVQDAQFSNWGDRILHVDFRQVDENTIVREDVPVEVSGVSPAVKFGGVLQVIRRRVPVTCKLKDLPEHIKVDVSNLNFGESIHFDHVPYPEGVKPIIKGRNPTIATVAGRKRNAADEAAAAVEAEAAAAKAAANTKGGAKAAPAKAAPAAKAPAKK